MERKPDQVRWKRFAAREACGLIAAMLFLCVGSLPVRAQSAETSAAFIFGGGYPSCTRLCPSTASLGGFFPGRCCSAPDVYLAAEFRGPSTTLGKSLNEWYVQTFWPMIEKRLLSDQDSVTNRIIAQIKTETTRRGTLLNGQTQIAAISSLQRGQARAANHYSSSESLCRFATLARTLGSSESGSDSIRIAMSKASIDRQLITGSSAGSQNTSGENGRGVSTQGQSADKKARWKQYLKTFCNPADYSQGQAPSGVCETAGDQQYNRDINYVATLGEPLTLDIGAGATASKDTVNLAALSKNLYAHDLVNTIPPAVFDASSEDNANQTRKYMRFLSAVAKHAVAENSFNSIAAMKAKGSASSAKYVQNLMIELGVPADQARQLVTENPSYYAQMEALTRSMYQSPGFYVNLMEGPINVRRQQAAMKSLELMQQRDMYKSFKRSEMLMATLLEMELSKGQGAINKTLGQGKGGGS